MVERGRSVYTLPRILVQLIIRFYLLRFMQRRIFLESRHIGGRLKRPMTRSKLCKVNLFLKNFYFSVSVIKNKNKDLPFRITPLY